MPFLFHKAHEKINCCHSRVTCERADESGHSVDVNEVRLAVNTARTAGLQDGQSVPLALTSISTGSESEHNQIICGQKEQQESASFSTVHILGEFGG